MLLRAAQIIPMCDLHENMPAEDFHQLDDVIDMLRPLFCLNRTTGEVQGMQEHDDHSDWYNSRGIKGLDNNNGACLLDIDADGNYSIGFLVGRENGGDLRTVHRIKDFFDTVRLGVHTAGYDPDYLAALDEAEKIITDAEDRGHAMTQKTATAMTRPSA